MNCDYIVLGTVYVKYFLPENLVFYKNTKQKAFLYIEVF